MGRTPRRPDTTEALVNADQLVDQYILKRFRLDHPEHRACQELHVVQADAEDGTLGPPTWCDNVTFTAIIACGGPCEAPAPRPYVYDELGDLAGIIEQLDREQAATARESAA
jgi:hypothetical protein